MNPVVRPCESPEPTDARSPRRSAIVALAVLMASAAPFDRAAAANLQQSFSHAKCPVSGRTIVRPGECVEVRVKKSDLGDFHVIRFFSPGTRASGLVFNDMDMYFRIGDETGGFSMHYGRGSDAPPNEEFVLGKICARAGFRSPPGTYIPPPPGEKEPYRIGIAPEFWRSGDAWTDYSRVICLEYFRE